MPTSMYDTLSGPSESRPSGKMLLNGCACAVTPALTSCLTPIDRPSVAMTSGITPWRISGSTIARLNV